MEFFQLSNLSKSRVWWDVSPFDGSTHINGIAVELFVPHGPRSEYALLGASLIRGRGGVLLNCPEDLGPWDASLAKGLDEVRRGLPSEYRAGICEWGGRAAAQLTDQTLVYDCAAHGAIGSSVAIFARLAVAVAKIIIESDRSNDAQIRDFLEAARKQS